MDSVCSFWRRPLVWRRAVIDDCVFRLHYKLTFLILLALSILVAWRQHFGPAISCTSSTGDFSGQYLNEYCYAQSTYSLVDDFNKTVGQEVPYPGMGKSSDSKKVYHSYYPWVSLVIFIQAMLFLVPRHFWKYMESGRVEDMVKQVAKMDMGKEDLREDSLRCLTKRIRSELNQTWKYFASYGCAETLNVVNVIGQIFFMNVFLGGGFSTYGPQVVQFSDWDSTDPGTRLFPVVAKCTLYTWGRSGDVWLHSASCLLPINRLYAKIYVFLWFWFIMLSVVSCLSLLHRLVFCLSPRCRVLSLMSDTRLVKSGDLREMVSNCSAADCFFVRLLVQNCNSLNFRDVVESLVKEDFV